METAVGSSRALSLAMASEGTTVSELIVRGAVVDSGAEGFLIRFCLGFLGCGSSAEEIEAGRASSSRSGRVGEVLKLSSPNRVWARGSGRGLAGLLTVEKLGCEMDVTIAGEAATASVGCRTLS